MGSQTATRRETVLSEQRPAQEGAGAYTVGDLLVSEQTEGGYVAVLTGVGPEGLWYESDDFGPFPTREQAEQAARDAYERDDA